MRQEFYIKALCCKPYVAFIAVLVDSAELEYQGVIDAIEAYSKEHDRHLPREVVASKVLFQLTWYPIAPSRKPADARHRRPRKVRLHDYHLPSFHGSRLHWYEVRRRAENERAAQAGAEWIAPSLSERPMLHGEYVPLRRHIPLETLAAQRDKERGRC
jgi:hypothetical protein